MKDLEQAFKEQSDSAVKRHNQIKKWFILSGIYIFILSLIFTGALLNISHSVNRVTNSNAELTQILERRSPILDYLQCHDNLEDTNSVALRAYIFAYIAEKDNPSDSNKIAAERARIKYEESNRKLRELSSCPKFPN